MTRPLLDLATLRQERLERLRVILRQADVAGALFLDPINIRYATDTTNMQVWCLHNPTRYVFVATEGPVILFEFATCEHLAVGIETIDEVRPATSWTYMMAGSEAGARAAEWAAEVADIVNRSGGGNRRLAVDRLDVMGFSALQRLGIEVAEGQELAEQARALKTPQELVAIRDCMVAGETSLQTMHNALHPGLSERELWSVLHQSNIALGGEWIETRLLASGPRTNPWYQECSDRIIEDGDLVAIDTDMVGRHGYCCDISRTWRTGDGQASDAQRRTYAAAHAHLSRLIELVGPGVTLGEIAEAVGEPPAGHEVYSCLVHGIGLCDEYPVAFWKGQSGRYDEVLRAGMTVCVESYLGPENAAEGVKLEQQVLITDSGVEVLNKLPLEDAWL